MVEMIQYSTQLVTNYEQVNTVHTYKNINTSYKYSTAQNLVHILY